MGDYSSVYSLYTFVGVCVCVCVCVCAVVAEIVRSSRAQQHNIVTNRDSEPATSDMEPQRHINGDHHQLAASLTSSSAAATFTQHQLDRALYGYASVTQNDIKTDSLLRGPALSGLRISSLSYGQSLSFHFSACHLSLSPDTCCRWRPPRSHLASAILSASHSFLCIKRA